MEERIAKEYKINEQITARSVRVVQGEKSDAPVMFTEDALRMAEEVGLDLVEVGSNQNPPVCRILDYGKFKYIQSKKEKEVRKASRGLNQLRQVRMTPFISPVHLDYKRNMVREFLQKGAKVQVSVMMRGRQRAYPESAVKVLRDLAETCNDLARVDNPPSLDSRSISMVLSPLAKRGKVGISASPKDQMASDSNGSEESKNGKGEEEKRHAKNENP